MQNPDKSAFSRAILMKEDNDSNFQSTRRKKNLGYNSIPKPAFNDEDEARTFLHMEGLGKLTLHKSLL